MPSRGQTPYERRYTHELYYARGSRGTRREWTDREMNAITAPDRPSDEELSLKLDRSILAIQVRRCKLGKV